MKKTLFILFFLILSSINSNAEIFLGVPLSEAKIKIGCLYPLSGKNKIYGLDSVSAMKIALAEKPESKISLIIMDSKSKNYIAYKKTKYLLNKYDVDILCGVVNSSVGLTVSEISKENKVIFLGTDHASSRLIAERFHKYYFRVSADTLQAMSSGALYLNELKRKNNIKTIAFIGPDYEYGHRAWQDLLFALKYLNLDFKIAGVFWPKLNEDNYSLYINEILRLKPDVLINAQWGEDLVNFLKQARNFQILDKTLFINFDTGGNYEVMEKLKNNLQTGLVMGSRHHNNWPKTDYNINYVNRFYQEASRYPTYPALGAYTSIKIVQKIIESDVEIENTDRIINFLESIEIKLPKDPAGFKSYMEPKFHQLLQVVALGKTVADFSMPPATRMLDNWKVYYPKDYYDIMKFVINCYVSGKDDKPCIQKDK